MPKKNPKHDSLRAQRKRQVIPPGVFIPGGPTRRVPGWSSPQNRAKSLNTQRKYIDILHDIESGIALIYNEHPEMTDLHALEALRALFLSYSTPNRAPPALSLLTAAIYAEVQQMLAWRVNTRSPTASPPRPILDSLACVIDSAQFWHRQGGTRGYLDYMTQFL